MTEEMKLKLMENLLKNTRVGQVNVVVESGATVNYYEQAEPAGRRGVPTDEQVGRAIAAINGQILNSYQRWFGVVHYLSTMCGWPSNAKECCERINRLPGHEQWAWPCKYENIRKFPSDKYGRIPFSEWDEYKPKNTERNFLEFRDVARSFDEQLQIEMQK